jgi:hypothetical protein
MFRSELRLTAVAALAAPAASAGAALAAQPARILVEPDVIASRDGNAPHVEVHVAGNPRNRNNLIAGAISHTRPDGTPASKAYYTLDGGLTWSDVSFKEQIQWGGGDPQVAFSETGTGFFATLTTGNDDFGRGRALLHVYRTDDGGASWDKPAMLGWSYDHPMMTVDRTRGPYAGRVYVSVLYGRDYHLGLFRSSDDGRSFVGPVDFWVGEKIGGNVLPMVVLSDGALVVPYHNFSLTPNDKDPKPIEMPFATVLSTDGGVTFSAPRPGPPERLPPRTETALLRLNGDGGFAADPSPRFRDRIYKVWGDFWNGRWRIVLSISTDRGASWSAPKPIDDAAPATAQQYLPAVAVNRDGVVGVTWYDTRHGQSPRGSDQYFAASLDGGASFLPSVRVSTETSNPLGAGNFAFTPLTFRIPEDSGASRLTFLSAVGRWINGGDYTGLAADAEGVFHPFWADSRTGTFQAMTARVRVEGAPETPWVGRPPPPYALARPASLVEQDVTELLELVPDPSRYDPASRELELRLRFKNTSQRTIFAPMTVTVRRYGSGMTGDDIEYSPEILNATSGGPGPGAQFDFGAALGTNGALPPGATSGALLIRLRLKDPLRVPDAHYQISGQVAKP